MKPYILICTITTLGVFTVYLNDQIQIRLEDHPFERYAAGIIILVTFIYWCIRGLLHKW